MDFILTTYFPSKGFRRQFELTSTLRTLVVSTLPLLGPAHQPIFAGIVTAPSFSRSPSSHIPECTTAKKNDEIAITCDYTEAVTADKVDPQLRVVLDHALVSFKTKHDNYMRLELTFRNAGPNQVSEARVIYLQIDDDDGHNCMRRILPAVDFRKLVPAEPLTFSTRLLSGAFRPGHYVINLWIPSSDPSLKLSSTHNLLLCSVGVGDASRGLNKIAEFTVEPIAEQPRRNP